MLNTFLFDLDGTLLPLDWNIFEKEYFKKLSKKFSGHFEPEQFVKQVWSSTKKMLSNEDSKKTNQQVFFEDFFTSTGKDMALLNPIFDDFYSNDFNELGYLCKSESHIIDTINLLIKKGYDIVVATNPIFPLAAIKARIGWAGLKHVIFRHITCFENMHYCKPNIKFYNEVLRNIDKRPDECIMVGNDVEEDIVASKLGIKTFLVEDFMIDRGNIELHPDFRGLYKGLYDFVDNLPFLFSEAI